MKLTCLITAGPTREYIDPVRYISNASSGMMGYALAHEAIRRGNRVILVSGPVKLEPPRKAKIVNVVSASDMFTQVKKYFNVSDIMIGSAAVSDYRPARFKNEKIKKGKTGLSLKLAVNPDIIAYCGKIKGKRAVAGFALESENLVKNAAEKLKSKNLDLIVANSPAAIESGMVKAAILLRDGKKIFAGTLSKEKLAGRIMDEIIGIWKTRKACKTQP